MSVVEKSIDAVLELRKRYRGYMPWELARLPGQEMLYEFVSWPWIETPAVVGEQSHVKIMARPIDDSQQARTYEARKQIHPVRWSAHRQKAYRQGFRDGVKYAIQEARKFREAKCE